MLLLFIIFERHLFWAVFVVFVSVLLFVITIRIVTFFLTIRIVFGIGSLFETAGLVSFQTKDFPCHASGFLKSQLKIFLIAVFVNRWILSIYS